MPWLMRLAGIRRNGSINRGLMYGADGGAVPRWNFVPQ
jgi:hypothetical protein